MAAFSNITGLQWRDVNLRQREIDFRIKSNIPGGKLLTLPITDSLMEVLTPLLLRPQYKNKKRVVEENGNVVLFSPAPADYVFTYKGEPIQKFRRSFDAARIKAGILNFRVHDLRHTAASWMVQSGVPIDLVQEILGHTQIATTKKYAHRDQNEKLSAVQKLTLATQSRHISEVQHQS